MKPPKPLRKLKISPASLALWSIVILALVLIITMANLNPATENVPENEIQPVPVSVRRIEPSSLEDIVILPARTEANISALLAVEKAGRITAITVDKGDTVSQGQTLLQIDDRHWKTQWEQARVEQADAERDLQRWQQMHAEGAVSQSEFDAIQRRYDLAVIAAERAKVDFDQCTLKAPFDGVIDARMLEIGEFANEGLPAFRLVNDAPLKIQLSVPERDVSRLAVGQTVKVAVPALDAATFEARIQFVAREAAANTFSFPVELVVEQPPAALRPGMIVNVHLVRGHIDQAVVVPLASVIPQRGEHVVFVASSNIATRTIVKIQTMTGQSAIISEGLNPGDHLIMAGHRGLQDGTPITIEEKGE